MSVQPRDTIHRNWDSKTTTFIIPLTFTDIRDAKDIITRIGYGGDVWELRVDLLSPERSPRGDVNIPPLDYVREQVAALQEMSPMPILFTIRTKSQGGKFPGHEAKAALDLMLLAIERGIEYIDVEIEWPESVIRTVTSNKQSTKIVSSYHDWTGNVRWTGEHLKQCFELADKFGDIVKLSILSADLEDCYDLGLFVRDHRRQCTKPLLAVGMGSHGQLSRITSPISLVTHPLIPFPSAPGQLSLADVHRARHLLGLLPAKKFHVTGPESFVQTASQALQAAFDELGYPYTCVVKDSSQSEVTACSVTDFESACSQFSEWTGRPAPESVIQKVLS